MWVSHIYVDLSATDALHAPRVHFASRLVQLRVCELLNETEAVYFDWVPMGPTPVLIWFSQTTDNKRTADMSQLQSRRAESATSTLHSAAFLLLSSIPGQSPRLVTTTAAETLSRYPARGRPRQLKGPAKASSSLHSSALVTALRGDGRKRKRQQ